MFLLILNTLLEEGKSRGFVGRRGETKEGHSSLERHLRWASDWAFAHEVQGTLPVLRLVFPPCLKPRVGGERETS